MTTDIITTAITVSTIGLTAGGAYFALTRFVDWLDAEIQARNPTTIMSNVEIAKQRYLRESGFREAAEDCEGSMCGGCGLNVPVGIICPGDACENYQRMNPRAPGVPIQHVAFEYGINDMNFDRKVSEDALAKVFKL